VQLILENVRCFAGRHAAPLAPLTLLIGENSSGKSSFLAMARVGWDALNRPESLDFNEEPFRLGAFSDIASRTASGRADHFTVGFRLPARNPEASRVASSLPDAVEARVRFNAKDAQPGLAEWVVESGEYSIRHKPAPSADTPEQILHIKAPSGTLSLGARDLPMSPSFFSIQRNWHYFRMRMRSEKPSLFGRTEGSQPSKPDLEQFEALLNSLSAMRGGRPYASAPIRTRPSRTYDPVSDKPTPEGDHIPMLLAKLKSTRPNDPRWIRLTESLKKFGIASGMFTTLDVRRMGGDEANLPFQISVGMEESLPFNLIDVGYGVSQVLPILVDATNNVGRMLLLQQPEVHLHPRAQAALGSFLAELANSHQEAPIIVETHSDYLLDRIRMDVRDGNGIKASDVMILYFDRQSTGVVIHPIRIDDHGNLIDVPQGYRSFFMEEERRLFQVEYSCA
jgi:hypothetical protein